MIAPTTRGLAIPSTFRGVANLAIANRSRFTLWLVAAAVATSLLLTWSIHLTWFTAFSWAAAELPESGRIHQGILEGVPTPPRVLSASKFLGIVLDPAGLRNSGTSSDLLLSIEDRGVAFQSVLGWMWIPYPPELSVPLDRLGVSAWIAAWTAPALLAIAGTLAIVLIVTWLVLGALYAPAVAFLARLLKRHAPLGRAWRLATAALLTPGLLLAGAVALYANHQLTLIGLLLAWPTHLVVGWLFAGGALFHLPAAPQGNPFAPCAPAATLRDRSTNPGTRRASGSANPFRSS